MHHTGCLDIHADSLSEVDLKIQVLTDVLLERKRQDDKWGSQRHLCSLLWNAILGEEVGEAAKEVLEHDDAKLEAELIQVAAVAVAWLEALKAKRIV